MPNIKFNIKVYLENAAVLPELQSRVADLTPAFEAIFNEWVDINKQKFEQSVGREATGAQIFEEFWAPLSAAYMKAKHGGGTARVTKKMARGKASAQFSGAYPDWLMVRTGALREAMTNPDSLFQNIEPQSAVFGTPLDPGLADIVRWLAGARQKNRYVVFLSDPDVNAIKRILQDYFGMGGDFQTIRSTKALAAIGREREIESLDAEFNSQAGGE